MTEVGRIYAEALYTLARGEGLSETILRQLKTLDSCFAGEPDFLRLLGAANLPKAERCRILDDCFCGRLQPYLLNFLKILTEKGYMRYFPHCVLAYRDLYNRDHNILPVTATTAVPLTDAQQKSLTAKLRKLTGKQIELTNKLDPAILGGIRLDYDGKRVDDTISHRLDAVRSMLQTTVL